MHIIDLTFGFLIFISLCLFNVKTACRLKRWWPAYLHFQMSIGIQDNNRDLSCHLSRVYGSWDQRILRISKFKAKQAAESYDQK